MIQLLSLQGFFWPSLLKHSVSLVVVYSYIFSLPLQQLPVMTVVPW